MSNLNIFAAPRAFEAIVKILKDLLPSGQRNRVYMFGYDRTAWREHLTRLIDDDQIPVAFGGNRTNREMN